METEYEVSVRAIVSTTLDKNELERRLGLALWEAADCMDESEWISDGQCDALRVIEYLDTEIQEFLH